MNESERAELNVPSVEEESERSKHLQWCKDRALEYVRMGDLQQAFTSFASDVGKHPLTENIRDIVANLGMPLLMGGHLNTPKQMEDHINGYN